MKKTLALVLLLVCTCSVEAASTIETHCREITSALNRELGGGVAVFRMVEASEGFSLLGEELGLRFADFTAPEPVLTSSARESCASLLAGEKYFSRSPEEQKELLLRCLSISPRPMTDFGSVPALSDGTFELKEKRFIEKYNVRRGVLAPVWCHEISFSDGGSVSIFSAEEDSPAVGAAAGALCRFPPAERKYIERVIYLEDGAEVYNADKNTVWLRLSSPPDEDTAALAIAHELGHILDLNLAPDASVWEAAMRADVLPVSSYGSTSQSEDMAEFCRLFHTSLGDGKKTAEAERLYPNRMCAMRALLYECDSEYFAEFKEAYYALSAYEEQNVSYAVLSPEDSRLVLSLHEERISLDKNRVADYQLWQIKRRKDGGVELISRESELGLGVNEALPAGSEAGEIWDIFYYENNLVSLRCRKNGLWLGASGNSPMLSDSEQRWTMRIMLEEKTT